MSVADSWGKITAIPEEAFIDNKLPSLPPWGAVTSIGKHAFTQNNLVVLPDSWGNVTTIEACAFASKIVYRAGGSTPNYHCQYKGAGKKNNDNQIQSLPSSWGKVKTIGAQSFIGNAITSLPNSWGQVTEIAEESFKDNKITALTAPWDTFTSIPRGAFLNNEIVSLPYSWGKITEIGKYSFLNNRLKALPGSWDEVTTIYYGAFANNELTAIPGSWGKVVYLGTHPESYVSSSEPYAEAFGSSRNELSAAIDKEKDKNQITVLPESLGDLWAINKNTFNWKVPRGQVFTVPDAPLIHNGQQHDRLAHAVEMIAQWSKAGWGSNITYGGIKGPIYLRPESGKNPNNIAGTEDVIILVNTNVRVSYLGPDGQPLVAETNRTISSQQGDKNNNYQLVPPAIPGYSAPKSQTIKLDGNDKTIVFNYEKAPVELSGTYARLDLIGELHKVPGRPKSKVLEDEIGEKLLTFLTYGGDNNTSEVKDGLIRITYDPTRVEDPQVTGSPSSGFSTIKVVAPGVLEVKLQQNFGGDRRVTIPLLWRLKERVTPSDGAFPITASLIDAAADGKQYVLKPHADSYPGPVTLKGHYKLPTFKKDTLGCKYSVCRNYDDDEEGNVKQEGNNAVTFTFAVKDLKRNVLGYTITDQLPLYTKADGTQARAQFVAAENPEWTLESDKTTLTYNSPKARLKAENEGLGSLKLHFPGAKKGLRIDNTASFVLHPEEQGPQEPDIIDSAETFFSFYKPMETTPPGVPLTKTADGPHYRYDEPVIFDTAQDRALEINWNVSTSNTSDIPGTITLRDYDLDTRLQYTGITPDPVFVGGKLEIISPTGEPGKYKVLYSVAITQPGRIELPAKLTEQYQNVQLRWNSVKAAQPGQSTVTRIHTKLRKPDAGLMDANANLCENNKCQSDLSNKVQGGERIKEANIKILPEGKTLQARKESSFHGLTLANNSGTYTVGAVIETDYGDPLTEFELVDVLPKGLDVNRVTLTQEFSQLPGASYEILSNFDGKGRAAVRFRASQVSEPGQVYSVARLETYISNRVSNGDLTNEAFVRAQGKVRYIADPNRGVTTVKNPVAGDGVWSRAEKTFQVAVGDEIYVAKRIREAKPGAQWVTRINTVGNAKFDYQLRLGYGEKAEKDPVIYDLLPVAGTPTRAGSTLVNRFDKTGQIRFEMADGTVAADWQTFYTCDTGIANKDLATASWSSNPDCGAVTGLKFANTSPQKPRSEVRITVPMIAGPEGVDPRSQSELGKQAINDFWSLSSNRQGALHSNKVINTLVPPAANIELKKLGLKFEKGQVTAPKALAGAKFGLFNTEGVLQASVLSDKSGIVKFQDVQAKPGWTVRELEAPLGYSPSTDAYVLSARDFSATNYDVATGTYQIKLPAVTNFGKWFPVEPFKGSAEFKKVDKNGQPLAGIEFTITPQPVKELKRDGNGNLVLDANGEPVPTGKLIQPNSAPITVSSNYAGEVKFFNIPAGKWQLTENPGGRNLQPINPIDFTITSCTGSGCTNLRGRDLHLGVNGKVVNKYGRVSLSKLGVRGMAGKGKTFGQWQRGDGVIKPGATFALYKGATVAATNQVGGLLTTGGASANVTLENLDLNQVYTLEETVAPPGYEKNEALLHFQIDQDGRLKDIDGNLLDEQSELLVPNEQEKLKSSLVITKVDPGLQGKREGFLEGAVFGLFKQDEQGNLSAEPIKKETTGATGQAEFTDIPGGIYRVKELKAPAGYYVDPQAQYDFVVDDYKTQQFTWTARNDRSRLRVFKFEPLVQGISEDAADKVVSGTPGAIKVHAQVAGTFDVVIPLKDAKFTLYENDEKTVVQADLTTDANGIVNLPASVKLDPDKVYKLKEIKAPAGYILKSNLISVKVSDYSSLSGFTGLVTMEVPNTKNTGRVTVSKLSQETGKPLADAQFTLKDVTANTEKILTTNDVGLATFTGLPFDHDYELRESKAPDGYKISADVEKFTLTSDKEPVKTFTWYNRLDKVDITLNKVDDNSFKMSGVVFELYKEGASAAEQTLTTGEDGTVKFTVEPGQTYVLKEISTNQGYALLPQPVRFKVAGNGEVTVISGKGDVNTVSGGDGSLTVTNYPEGKLPLSGYAGSLEVLLLGCLVLGIAIVFTLFERKRK